MKFLSKYYFLIIILLFFIIFLINYQNYQRTEAIIRSEFEIKTQLVENNILNSLKDAFATYSITEFFLNQEVDNNSRILLEKYKEDRNPKNWNLKELKTQMPDFVNSISFYKFVEHREEIILLNSSNPSEFKTVGSETKTMVKNTVENRESKIKNIDRFNYHLTQKYFPFFFSDSNFEWENHFVVRITYDNHLLLEQLEQESYKFILNMFIIFIVFIIFFIIMQYYIKKTEEMAYSDPLTGLPNRKAFEKSFNKHNQKYSRRKKAILYLDLDNFKEVNDKHGHDTGDLLLKAAARRLENAVRDKDKVSRMGGDEFTVMLTDVKSENDIKKIIKKIEERIAEPYQINDKTINISCSIGYSIDYQAERSLKELMNKADLAMYEVKNEKIKME